MKPNFCCGYPTDSAESLSSILGEEEERGEPRAGDLTICLNCGAWLVFMNERNATRLAQLRDIAQLGTEDLRRLKTARKYIRQRGRFWPRKRGGERFSPN